VPESIQDPSILAGSSALVDDASSTSAGQSNLPFRKQRTWIDVGRPQTSADMNRALGIRNNIAVANALPCSHHNAGQKPQGDPHSCTGVKNDEQSPAHLTRKRHDAISDGQNRLTNARSQVNPLISRTVRA
jgi:hypothetical protein